MCKEIQPVDEPIDILVEPVVDDTSQSSSSCTPFRSIPHDVLFSKKLEEITFYSRDIEP
jgi:hypothetical protein